MAALKVLPYHSNISVSVGIYDLSFFIQSEIFLALVWQMIFNADLDVFVLYYEIGSIYTFCSIYCCPPHLFFNTTPGGKGGGGASPGYLQVKVEAQVPHLDSGDKEGCSSLLLCGNGNSGFPCGLHKHWSGGGLLTSGNCQSLDSQLSTRPPLTPSQWERGGCASLLLGAVKVQAPHVVSTDTTEAEIKV